MSCSRHCSLPALRGPSLPRAPRPGNPGRPAVGSYRGARRLAGRARAATGTARARRIPRMRFLATAERFTLVARAPCEGVVAVRHNIEREDQAVLMGQLKGMLLRVLSITPLVLCAGVALAANCGDDVKGQRIPCACGDTVVSDARLARTDPVVTQRCLQDGLTIRAAGQVESLTLDLAGLPLTGSGVGVGIRVINGGSLGAILIGGKDGAPGQVAGFRVGVSARGARGLRAAENLLVLGNETDGLRISGRGTALGGVVADDNGRSGVRAHGRDHNLEGVSATGNQRYDLRVSGNGHFVGADPDTLHRGASRVTGSGNVVTPTAEAGR